MWLGFTYKTETMMISRSCLYYEVQEDNKCVKCIEQHLVCKRCSVNLFFPSFIVVVVVQSLSQVWLFVTLWTAARQASLSFTISRSSLKLMSIESVMPSNHLILSSPFLPTFNLTQHQGLFKWVSTSHQVAKVLAFQLQHQSFQWTPRTDLL